MADDNDNTNPPANGTPPAPPAPAQPSDTVTISRAELDALLEQKANAAAAATRRALEGKSKSNATQPPPEPPAPPVTTLPVSNMSASDIKRLFAFQRAVGAHGFSDEQVADLEALLEVQRPDNVGEWVSQKARAFGVGKPAAPAAQTTTQSPAQPAPTAPANMQPAAAMPSVAPAGPSQTSTPIADKLAMSPDQMAGYLRSLNHNPHNLFHSGSRKALRTVAEEGRRLLESVRVLPPDRGRDG